MRSILMAAALVASAIAAPVADAEPVTAVHSPVAYTTVYVTVDPVRGSGTSTKKSSTSHKKSSTSTKKATSTSAKSSSTVKVSPVATSKTSTSTKSSSTVKVSPVATSKTSTSTKSASTVNVSAIGTSKTSTSTKATSTSTKSSSTVAVSPIATSKTSTSTKATSTSTKSSSTVAVSPIATSKTSTSTKATTSSTKASTTAKATTSSTAKGTPVMATSTSTTAAGTVPTTLSQIVVYHHNLHRSNHSAPDIVWSDSLAAIAADIASSCVYAHDTTTGGGGYGQNIAAGVQASNISSVITELFYNGEMPYFNGLYGQANPSFTNFEHWGHFSQIVWKDTTTVGCAVQYCPGGLTNAGGNIPPYFTVCNYEPPGNYGGEYGTNIGAPLGRAIAHWNTGL